MNETDVIARPMAVLRYVLFALLLGLLVPLGASRADDTGRPALWHLSDFDSDIYIFGTVHILPPDLEWRYPALDAAFASADTLYLEVPAEPDDPAAVQALIMELGLNRSGQALTSSLSEAAKRQLSEIAPQVGLGAAQIDAMRPWLASLSISLGYLIAQGQDPQAGVESVLSREAARSGKKQAYLETLEQQFRFFADMDEALQVEMLEQTIEDIASGIVDAIIAEMDESWATGDIERLNRLVNDSMREQSPEVYRVLIVDRNRRWTAQIEQILAGSGTSFIAVGAGHLTGADSVITMLRARGHAISGP